MQTLPGHLGLGQIAGLQPLVHRGLCAAELILGHVISQGQVSRPQVGSRTLAPGLNLAHVGRLDIAQQVGQVAGQLTGTQGPSANGGWTGHCRLRYSPGAGRVRWSG